ncbi:MAG: response regulator [Bacteroidales bacterium]|nr:response regulator [Bacteroidales bacterium]
MNSSENVSPLILIAEDDNISFTFLKLVLTSHGYRVLHAENGQDAVELFKTNPDIAMVLMDVKMPGMNGLEATREIRKLSPTVPIIAQTAYALAGDSEKTLEAGCNDYVSKPVTADLLMKKINQYMGDK